MRLSVAVACLAASLAGAAAPAAPEIIDRILAVVAGHIITLSDVAGAMALGFADTAGAADPIGAALAREIDRRLMLAEVDRYGPPEPDPAEVARRAQAVRDRFASAEALHVALETTGLTDAGIEARARDDLRIATYLDQRFGPLAQPTDDQIARYYREHEAELRRDGGTPPLDEVREAIASRLAAERKQVLVQEWLAGLRRRTDVTNLYLPAR